MASFSYQAVDRDGALTEGEFIGLNREALLHHLDARGLVAISIKARGELSKNSILQMAIFEDFTVLDKVTFMRNLSASMRAGLGVIETMDILIADAHKGVIRNYLIKVKGGLESGLTLSDSLNLQKDVWSSVILGMIMAGERTGKLDVTLDQIAHSMTREYAMMKKVQSAMAYPIILLVGASLVVTLLLVFVIPKLAQTFSGSGIELPLITRMMLSIGSFISNNWLLLLGLIFALVVLVGRFYKTGAGARLTARISFRIPLIKEIVKKVVLVRFTRTLSNLISSGTLITYTLDLASEAVGNQAYKEAIQSSLKKITSGVSFSKTLEDYPELFPNFLISLIAVGEKTGTLEQVLNTFANFYEEDVDTTIKDLSSIIEPILLLIMGVVIGGVAISVLMPIYQLIGSFA